MNQALTISGPVQAHLRAQGHPHYVTHPRRHELSATVLETLRREQVNKSLEEAKHIARFGVEQAFEGCPVHMAMKDNPEATHAVLFSMLSETIALVKVANKIEGPREISYALEVCMDFRDFTIEDWRVIMGRIVQGTRKRYNKFEISDLRDYFVEYAGEKADVRERVVLEDQKRYQKDLEEHFAEFPGDFRTPEERIADREAGRRPKSYEDWVNGKTSISPAERQAMQERDRQRRNE